MSRKELHFYRVRCDERDCGREVYVMGDGQPDGWSVASVNEKDYVFCSREHAQAFVVRLAGVEKVWGPAPSFDLAAVIPELAK